MKTQRIRQITLSALITALILCLSLIPNTGFIQVGIISITTIAAIVILLGLIFGEVQALFSATIFGVLSCLIALTRGQAQDILFINPLISILPRVLWGFLVAGGSIIVDKVKVKKTAKVVLIAFISGILSIFHTFLVLTAIELFSSQAVFKYLFALNSIVEIILAMIIVPPLYISISKYDKIKQYRLKKGE